LLILEGGHSESRQGGKLLSSNLAKIFGDITLRDCALSALLVFVLVVPATCMILPHENDDMLESVQN